MCNFLKIYGRQAKCFGIDSRIFFPFFKYIFRGDFLSFFVHFLSLRQEFSGGKLKQKGFFHSGCKVIYEEGLPNIWGNAKIFNPI
jgi:hypothetical protein